nr:JmjC domain-containing protein [Tanacetum cinerariifolium]
MSIRSTVESKSPTISAATSFAVGSTNVPAVVPSGASTVPTGASTAPTGASTVPSGASTVPTGSPSVLANVPPSVTPVGVSYKEKSLMVAKDIPVKARTFKQMEEDRLGEEAAKRLHDEEQAQAQVEANASLSKTLLGDDVSEDNFPARMATLIKRKRQALAEKLAQEMHNRPMTQAQQRNYMRQYVKNQKFEKIQKVQSNSQIQAFSRTLKRTGPVLEEPSFKRQKSTEAPIPSVPEVPKSPDVSSPPSSDLDADAQTFINVISTEDSDDEAPPVWSALVGWEVISTPLGDINALYRIDQSTKHFTTLRQILHMVDKQDLVKLYGLVVKYYENHPVAGAGLILRGDLQVLFDSNEGDLDADAQTFINVISTEDSDDEAPPVWSALVGWELFHMFADVSYPLSEKLMEKMLWHKLEIDKDVVGNDMTTAEQLIQFLKNQLAAAQIMPILGTKKLASPEQTAPVSKSVAGSRFLEDSLMLLPFGVQCCWFEFRHADVAFYKDIPLICADFSSILVKTQSSRYVVPTSRVVVPTSRVVVPTGRNGYCKNHEKRAKNQAITDTRTERAIRVKMDFDPRNEIYRMEANLRSKAINER